MFEERTKAKPLPTMDKKESIKKVRAIDEDEEEVKEELDDDDLSDEEEDHEKYKPKKELKVKKEEPIEVEESEDSDSLTEESVKQQLAIINHRLARIEHFLRLDFF